MRSSLHILLGLSVALNLWYISISLDRIGHGAPKQAYSAELEEPPSVPSLTSQLGENLHSQHLLSQGFSETETKNINMTWVNRQFEQERAELLTISNPWLTVDEMYTECLVRIEKLREAEQRRRRALENISGQQWAVADLDFGWSKSKMSWLTGATRAMGKHGITDPAAVELAVTSVLAGIRDSSFEKLDPFGILRTDHIANVNGIAARYLESIKEAALPEVLPDLFLPYYINQVADVWDFKERFGSELSFTEISQVTKALMPSNPLLPVIGGADSHSLGDRELTKELLSKIQDIVDPTAFAHLLEFGDPTLQWSPEQHLQVYDLERNINEVPGPEESLQFATSLIELVGNEGLLEYTKTQRGRWLLPTIRE
jgi:hypothetical protein